MSVCFACLCIYLCKVRLVKEERASEKMVGLIRSGEGDGGEMHTGGKIS